MIRIIFIFLFCISAGLFSGCSEQPKDKMNVVRQKLVLEILNLTAQKRHDEAATKIRKLQEVDPKRDYLPLLEEVERSNAELSRMNNLLKQNKHEEIERYLKGLDQKKSSGSISDSAKKLKDAIRMEQLMNHIIDPQPDLSEKRFRPASQVLSDSIREFVILAQRWKVPASLRNKVIRRGNKLPGLWQEERISGIRSLELLALEEKKENELQTLQALIYYIEKTEQKDKLSVNSGSICNLKVKLNHK